MRELLVVDSLVLELLGRVAVVLELVDSLVFVPLGCVAVVCEPVGAPERTLGASS